MILREEIKTLIHMICDLTTDMKQHKKQSLLPQSEKLDMETFYTRKFIIENLGLKNLN